MKPAALGADQAAGDDVGVAPAEYASTQRVRAALAEETAVTVAG